MKPMSHFFSQYLLQLLFAKYKSNKPYDQKDLWMLRVSTVPAQ